MKSTRVPAVAGQFYPAQASELVAQISHYLAQADALKGHPKALIAPHAGYIYSGLTAAFAYKMLVPYAHEISRVILLGPAHRVGFRGIALPEAAFFSSPLGTIPIDQEANNRIIDLPQICLRDDAHQQEHSLEVQLPFLQHTLGSFSLVPLVVGECGAPEVAEVLERLWGGRETLIIVSTDLSHFHDYATARNIDQHTSQHIERLQGDLVGEQACGCRPLNGLLLCARRHGLKIRLLDMRNSGDTAGSKDRVVGYASYALH